MKTIYTVYSEEADMTFILEDTYENETIMSTEVVGFYYGEPNEKCTEEYKHKPLVAMY